MGGVERALARRDEALRRLETFRIEDIEVADGVRAADIGTRPPRVDMLTLSSSLKPGER